MYVIGEDHFQILQFNFRFGFRDWSIGIIAAEEGSINETGSLTFCFETLHRFNFDDFYHNVWTDYSRRNRKEDWIRLLFK